MGRRNNRLVQDYHHDPYFMKERLHDPGVCTSCGVVFHKGVFAWLPEPPPTGENFVCPACRRIKDRYEGGTVCLSGDFLGDHHDEILGLIKNTESLEKKERPLERIIAIAEKDGEVEIKTTYEHLARRIGEALHSAWKGELKLQYRKEEKYLRVWWSRNG